MKGVAVTGMGIISALGGNVEENLCALKTSKHGLSQPEILKTIHRFPVGEIKINNASLSEKLGLPEDHSFTRAALLGALSIKEIQKTLNITSFPDDTGFISGTSVGGIDMTENYFYDFGEKPNKRKYIQAQHPGYTTENIAQYFGLNNFVTTISTACSSSANAIMLGARMIQAGKLKRVIVGGTDCLTKFTLNGFNSLKILSTENSKAFDEHRNGLNLGEAAAFLMLEAEDVLEGKKVLGRVSGYGNANDAFHQTASSENGEGAYLSIQKALQQAGLSASEIDYINAHGTGTVNNDLAESHAIIRSFGKNIPEFSSTKAFTGHTLGAAGAVEAIFSLLAIQNQEIYPALNFQHPMAVTGLKPATSNTQKKIENVLSNSFGFGGNCTSLIFQRNG